VASFTDNTGQSWPVSLTLGSLQELKNVGVDLVPLLSQKNPGVVQALKLNPFLVGSAMWIVCDPSKSGLTQEQFASRMGGDQVEEFFDALMEAFVDFSQPSEVRDAAKQAMKTHVKQAYKRAIRELNSLPSGDGG
jgi:hypothetical protein